MQIVSTIAAARETRARLDGTLGFVPTMGFLHEGHLSLVRRAQEECDAVAVSIFVNPTQFAPDEDLNRYPRALERDLSLLREAGVSLVFTPDAGEIYPPGFDTSIDVGEVSRPLEGAFRPGHFSGVATVVAKLFNIIQPTKAFFGQKDAQQCAVISKLVTDLNIPVEVVVCDIVRNEKGLALSSRNSYLSKSEQERALLLHDSLGKAEGHIAAGERNASTIRALIGDILSKDADFCVDYISVADPHTLTELENIDDEALISLAVRVGATRLIDNVVVRKK
ncbi:pantoate--beta-alanine ligase [Acetobacter sp.]|jgi:pantoate--beta-alanine ligase|uniref:pantoate--beta-alanine ligase n=1 Tax=Acetobacter sp. TaxID=440 RepID=UPI0025BA0287|nr:pantoate--beta-alanine ligase [Acetobacter sp.]MCH4090928.1 pantoate--beta-alanine ligase [Acetobacter sp.]MCI1300769.1 pantoate--beta-alanine ligase [Acetobacter sp.]MCI1317126.1 pantoate--beta-alanine ligase [Acetobacter sp.]